MKSRSQKPARTAPGEELDRLLEEIDRKIRPTGKSAETDLTSDPLSTSYWCYVCCGG